MSGIVKSSLNCHSCNKTIHKEPIHAFSKFFCCVSCLANYEAQQIVHEAEVVEAHDTEPAPAPNEDEFSRIARLAQEREEENRRNGINRENLRGIKLVEHDVGNVLNTVWKWATEGD